MDRRRFFNGQALNENISHANQLRYTLEEVFNELNSLYEDVVDEKT